MSGFSSLMDISSFFIGVLVNLLLVAMICFYFKRKIDNLEMSQSEQAKILFNLLKQQSLTPNVTQSLNEVSEKSDKQDENVQTYKMLNGLDLSQLEEDSNNEENEDDSDDDDSSVNSDDKSDDESDEEMNVQEMNSNEIKTIDYEQINEMDSSIEKLTIKELRNLLESKGVHVAKKNVRKQDLINMYMENNNVENLIEEVIKVDTEELNEESGTNEVNNLEVTVDTQVNDIQENVNDSNEDSNNNESVLIQQESLEINSDIN